MYDHSSAAGKRFLEPLGGPPGIRKYSVGSRKAAMKEEAARPKGSTATRVRGYPVDEIVNRQDRFGS
jgi:hypothetical protein